MFLSNCAICGKKKLIFLKKKKNSTILMISSKMNKAIKKYLLNGNKVLPELHLKQLGFTCSACRPLTKHLERIQIFREIDNLKHLQRNELDKACFVYNATNSDWKRLARRATVFQIRF